MDAVAAMKSAVPTSRHAEMVVDALVARLGDEAVVETGDGGQRLQVYRRDREHRDWIVPWPILRFVRGRRLGHVQGAEGPPTDAPPPAGAGPPPRLRGLTSGELEVSNGRHSIQITYGEDGALAETARGGPPDLLGGLAAAVRRRDRNPVESLVDELALFDPAALGSGRVHFPGSAPAVVEGRWLLTLHAVRDALFEGRVLASARWVATDGYAGAVVCAGATRAEALSRCRAEIRRVRPRPPKAEPPPPLPEFLSEHGVAPEAFLITGPRWDAPRVEPAPENTPIGILELPPPPRRPPPLGTWLPLVDERGASSHAALRRDAHGITVVGAGALGRIDPARLDPMLDAAERAWHDQIEASGLRLPSSGTPPASVAVCFALEEEPPGALRARVQSSCEGPGFRGREIRAEELAAGVLRQRWVR